MPPGFGLLDTALISVPVFLILLGLIRGAPVELASCCGCIAGFAMAWFVSCLPPLQALGQPAAPLLALLSGVVAWRIMGGLSNRFGFDTRWIDLGRLFDVFAGGVMGGVRGVAFVAAGCLAYAMIAVPLGLANPMRTVAYPVFLAIGSHVTSTVIEATEPVRAEIAELAPSSAASSVQSLATVPLPFVAPQIGTAASGAARTDYVQAGYAQTSPAPSPGVTQQGNGPGLSALIHSIAPSAAAAPTQPRMQAVPVYHPDVPVRGIPVGLMETHHNILHPLGLLRRVHH